MLDSEAVMIAFEKLKEAQKHLSAALTAFQGTVILYRHLKTPIQDQITAASAATDDAFRHVNDLVADQSSWGRYESHPSGNNN